MRWLSLFLGILSGLAFSVLASSQNPEQPSPGTVASCVERLMGETHFVSDSEIEQLQPKEGKDTVEYALVAVQGLATSAGCSSESLEMDASDHVSNLTSSYTISTGLGVFYVIDVDGGLEVSFDPWD